MKKVIFECFRKMIRAVSGKGLGLARVPGLQQLSDWFSRRLSPKGIVLLDVHGSKMFFDTDLETPLRTLITFGTYEPFETRIFQSLLRPGMVVADIGANIGYYSLISAKAVGDSGRVFAFEPDPRNYDLLLRSIQANGYTNVVPRKMALSDKKGSITLYADSLNAGNSSLGQSNIQREGGSYEVETDTLDSFILAEGKGRKIDLIKMDVQGAEGMVLEGARGLLTNGSLALMMEFEPDKLQALSADPAELLRRLRGFGFRVRMLDSVQGKIIEGTDSMVLATCASEGYVNLLLEK